MIKAAALGITVSIDGLTALGDLLAGAFTAAFEAVTWAADQLIDAYLLAWRDDIDAGLLDLWAEVGRLPPRWRCSTRRPAATSRTRSASSPAASRR